MCLYSNIISLLYSSTKYSTSLNISIQKIWLLLISLDEQQIDQEKQAACSVLILIHTDHREEAWLHILDEWLLVS